MRILRILAISACLAACLAPGAYADDAARVDFVRDVIPALTKAGCNAGACHGSFQGRGGLKLSLLGFDPAAAPSSEGITAIRKDGSTW